MSRSTGGRAERFGRESAQSNAERVNNTKGNLMKKFWMFGVGALSLGLTALPALAEEQVQRKPGDLPGPIDSLEDLQDTGRMLFKLADENNDGQISQKEAIDAGNLLVGGFFFRADKNGDGVLSPDEAKEAREAFLSTKPWVRYAVGTAKTQLQKDGAHASKPEPEHAGEPRRDLRHEQRQAAPGRPSSARPSRRPSRAGSPPPTPTATASSATPR